MYDINVSPVTSNPWDLGFFSLITSQSLNTYSLQNALAISSAYFYDGYNVDGDSNVYVFSDACNGNCKYVYR